MKKERKALVDLNDDVPLIVPKPPIYLDARDHFAMAALTGIMAAQGNYSIVRKDRAKWAYEMADALLEARKQ